MSGVLESATASVRRSNPLAAWCWSSSAGPHPDLASEVDVPLDVALVIVEVR